MKKFWLDSEDGLMRLYAEVGPEGKSFVVKTRRENFYVQFVTENGKYVSQKVQALTIVPIRTVEKVKEGEYWILPTRNDMFSNWRVVRVLGSRF